MCILDLLRSYVSVSFKYDEETSSIYSQRSSISSGCSVEKCDKNLNLKHSSLYPEFMMLQNDELDTMSTSLQGSRCSDFIYTAGNCENLHGVLNGPEANER